MAYDIAQPDSLLWNVMQLVEEELRYISKRLHPNVAVLAGVLQGYDGLNGYVVVTEGIPIEQFVLQARSGAAWANCIQGLTSFENDFRGSSAENITVRTDGHVVVFPSYGFSPLLASPNLLVNYVPTLQWDDIDPELRFLHKIYMANYWRFGTRRLEQFVASCSGLGPGFTKLQVTYLAASSGLLPLLKNYSHTWFGTKSIPFPALRVGDFGLVTAPDREYSLDPPAWTFLDKSRYFKDQDFTISRVMYLTYSGSAPEVDGYPWLSYNLNDQLQRNQSYIGLHITLNNLAEFQCEWKDILAEARELSKHHNVSVDTMSLCEKISYSAWMRHSPGDLKPNPGATMYFHRNPHSDDPTEFWGFFSPSIDPKCRTSQTELENSGWTYYYTIQFSTYDVSNDWGRRYEERLESGIASMPGSYLGATIEEIM